MSARVIRQFALHKDGPTAWVVSRVGETRTVAISKRGTELRHVKGGVALGPKGVKLALVEVDMPEWAAREWGVL